MADLGGANSFVFTYIFAKKCPRRRLAPPQWLGAPPTGNPGSATAYLFKSTYYFIINEKIIKYLIFYLYICNFIQSKLCVIEFCKNSNITMHSCQTAGVSNTRRAFETSLKHPSLTSTHTSMCMYFPHTHTCTHIHRNM